MGKSENTKYQVEEKILEAAREVFTRKGYAAASMRDIADRAEVNKGLIHYYKWNKRKLFLRVFEDAFSQFIPRVNQVFNSDLPLFEKIERFVDHYMDMLLANPHLPAFVVNELNHHPEEFISHFLSRRQSPNPSGFLSQIHAEAQAGRIRPIDPFHFFLNLLSMCVFPFLAKPLFQHIIHLDEDAYLEIMGTRKQEIVDFAIRAIQKPSQ